MSSADASSTDNEYSLEDQVPAGYHWIRFKWMFWLGCCMHWHKRWQFLLAILMPSILSLIVIFLRVEISAEHITATSSPAIDLAESWQKLLQTINQRQKVLKTHLGSQMYSTYIPRIRIAYAPDTELNNKIMTKVCVDLDNIKSKKFRTCDKLREKMAIKNYLAGVCLDEDINDSSQRLNIRLIFPSELRIYKKEIGETWHTSKLYNIPLLNEHMHGFMTYIDEGFMMLQKLISETYIDMMTNGTLSTKFFLRKFPAKEHYYDPVAEELQMRLSLLLVLGYMTTISRLLKALVIEREKKLDGMLRILDVAPFIQFCSWFVFTLISMTIGSLVLLFVLKIPWNNGFAIFNRASFSCLLTLLTAFNIYSLSFCYMISKFFRRPKVAISAAAIFWFIFYLPFASSVDSSSTLSHTLHPFISIFGSSAFGFAIQRINILENDKGLHWSNMFESYDLATKGYSVGTYILIMCGVSIVQAVIGIYVSKFEQFLRKLIDLQKKRQRSRDSDTSAKRYSQTIILELRANYKPTALEVIALTVMDGNKILLDDISFSIYEDEITMLIGHNGSGKTTLIEVLAGIRRQTSGAVFYPGSSDNASVYSIAGIQGSSDFVGVCFSDTLLFKNLNVGQQLMFFGQMKGLPLLDLKLEMNKYLEALKLKKYRHVRTAELTCGQRTKLAVACALIGGSKVILLDDIVSKLDAYEHDLIWKLLQTEKFGRIILATTISTTALALHADNIIILGQGRLKCVGSSQFLKSIYNFGCHILIAKDENCISEDVTKIMTKYIPDLTPTGDIDRELCYTIESSKVEILPDILKELENNKQRLNIMNITIIETPVEEMFLKLGAERPAYDDRKQFVRMFHGLSMTSEEDDDLVFLKKHINYQMSSFRKTVNQWHALFYKYYIFYSVHKIVIPLYIFLPLFFSIYFAVTIVPQRVEQRPVLQFDIADYRDSIGLISTHKKATAKSLKYIDGYKQYIYWKNSNIRMIAFNDAQLVSYVTRKQSKNEYGILNLRTMLGMACYGDVVGWFNGYLPHIAPVALNLLHNGYLRAFVVTDTEIDVELEVLPLNKEVFVGELSTTTFNTGSKLALCIAFTTCYFVSFRIFLLVAERTNGFKNLQSFAGVSSFNYWMALFVFDLFKHSLVITVCTIALWFIYPRSYMSVTVISWFVQLLLLLCAALSSTNYLLSLFFKSTHKAFLFITTLQCMGLAFFMGHYGDLAKKAISGLPRIFPLYCFCLGIHRVYEGNIRKILCEDEIVNSLSEAWEKCGKQPNCCEKNDQKFQDDAMYLWLIIITSWIGILMYECRGYFHSEVPFDNYDRALDEHKRRHASTSNEVDNVTAEMISVRIMKPQQRYLYNVVCENLGLIKHGKVLVDRVSLTIKAGDILGIMGTNCTNTQAMLNLLYGNPRPSFGRLYINGVSMTACPEKAKTFIGYIPAYCGIMDEMTCQQALKIFCILYGYERYDIDEICENLSKNLSFYTQYHTPLMACSPGIKARISQSIAVLKKPALLCYGNYGSVDPTGERQFNRLLMKLRAKIGTSVAVTSVYNTFTELICNKIVFMTNAQFTHIGHPLQISPHLTNGYIVLMRMKKQIQTLGGVIPKVFFRLTAFMEDKFPTSRALVIGSSMQYFIPHQSTTLAILFQTLRENASKLNIDNLFITRMDMGYVFGQITEDALGDYNPDSTSSSPERSHVSFFNFGTH